ncbi:MAG: hypothetical protein KatS3mg088_058 [Patescibacteria group bacterium]|nr:MAG: hypothetical protein KatS3mg088_058 [Patescibacteria group bacterium]
MIYDLRFTNNELRGMNYGKIIQKSKVKSQNYKLKVKSFLR